MTALLLNSSLRPINSNAEFGLIMEWILRNTVRTFLESERVKTFYDVSAFPENTSYKSQVLGSVRGRELRGFWRNRNLSQSIINDILNRLFSFLDRPYIRQ